LSLPTDEFIRPPEMSQVQRILPTEVRETAQLYLDGKIASGIRWKTGRVSSSS
jgi:hypothetical protein